MDKYLKTILFSFILSSLLASSYAQSCDTFRFSNSNSYSTCSSLPVLNSFLHWNYHQGNHTVDIAYRHGGVSTSQWVAWALNIGGSGMIGSQALVAFTNSSGLVHAYTSPVTTFATTLAEGNLSFSVPRIEAEYSNNEMIIYATLQLPSGRTSFSQVWQEGPVSGDTLGQHPLNPANRNSVGTVDFITGQTGAGSGSVGGSRQRKRNVSDSNEFVCVCFFFFVSCFYFLVLIINYFVWVFVVFGKISHEEVLILAKKLDWIMGLYMWI